MHKQTFYQKGTKFIAAIMIVMLALVAMPTSLVQAADTGWQNPTNNAATTGGDNNGFETNPANAYTDGAGNATNNNGASDRHLYYGYNFSGVPSGDIIDGISKAMEHVEVCHRKQGRGKGVSIDIQDHVPVIIAGIAACEQK